MVNGALALLLLFAWAAGARSVALLVNFGDEGGKLNDKFAADLERAREIYAQLGYDVVVVPPSQDVHAAVEKGFAQVGKADGLAIETMGHGITDFPPKSLGARFPSLKHEASGGLYTDRADAFHFHNGGLDTRGDFMKALDSPDFAKKSIGQQFKHDVGAGDLARLIENFRSVNPRAPVRVSIGECYAGHAARTLQKIDGVAAYAESDDRSEAHIFEDGRSFTTLYLDEMERAARARPRPAAIEVFTRSRRAWIALSKTHRDHVEIPWSPVDALAHDWCAEHPVSKLSGLAAGISASGAGSVMGQVSGMVKAAGASPGALGVKHARLKALTDDTLMREGEIIEDQESRRRCRGSSRAADLRRAIGKFAAAEIEILREMKKLAGDRSSLANGLDKGIACLTATPEGTCSIEADLVETPLPAAWGDAVVGLGQKECLAPEPATSEACLGVARGLKPRAAYDSILGAREDLAGQLSDCDRPDDRKHLNYYKSCYDRFWSANDARAEKKLGALEGQIYAPVGVASASSADAGASSVK